MSVYINYEHLSYAYFYYGTLQLGIIGSQDSIYCVNKEAIQSIVAQLNKGLNDTRQFLETQRDNSLGMSHFCYSSYNSSGELEKFIVINVQDIVYMFEKNGALVIYFSNSYALSLGDFMFQDINVSYIYNEILQLL